MALAQWAEIEGMLLNGQGMVPIRPTLIAIYYPKPDNDNFLKSDRKLALSSSAISRSQNVPNTQT